MPLETSEEICEALTRHVEATGSEAFGKHYEKDGTTRVAIFCVLGPNAQAFRDMVERWLDDNGFNED